MSAELNFFPVPEGAVDTVQASGLYPMQKILRLTPWANFKKTDAFRNYVFAHAASNPIYLEMATDGQSPLYRMFLQHCKDGLADTELALVMDLKDTVKKFDDYENFMKSFHKVMAKIEEMNI